MILGLEAGNDQMVAVLGQIELRQTTQIGRVTDWCSVGQEHARGVISLAIIVRNSLGIGDQFVSKPDGYTLIYQVVPAADRAPLSALPFQPVDVHGYRDASCADCGQQWCIGSVENDRRIAPVTKEMPD
ncbi:hypothetical protein QV65_02025 [Rhodococcus erythropolis]|nr:hypothetical protein QV65_02025 [Rhodococcus erythropolis]